MASESENTEPQTDELTERLPGAALRAKREAGGYSLDDVSKDTRITCSRLTALENDDYAKVGSHPFIVGYIRKYAKWLDMDGDELVRDYERQVRAETPEDEVDPAGGTTAQRQDGNGTGGEAQNVRAAKKPLLWISLVVIVLLVGAAVFLTEPDSDPSPGSASAPESDVEASADDAAATDTATMDTQSSGSASTDARTEAAPAITAPTNEVTAQPGAEVGGSAEETAEPRSPAAGPSASEEAAEQPAVATEPAPIEDRGLSAAEDSPAPANTPAATDTLTMAFSDSCWVEVRDANGNLLFAQLQQAGDNLRLRGAAPFQVLLGNARAVDLRVNGRAVDTNPGSGRNTLRTSVGP